MRRSASASEGTGGTGALGSGAAGPPLVSPSHLRTFSRSAEAAGSTRATSSCSQPASGVASDASDAGSRMRTARMCAPGGAAAPPLPTTAARPSRLPALLPPRPSLLPPVLPRTMSKPWTVESPTTRGALPHSSCRRAARALTICRCANESGGGVAPTRRLASSWAVGSQRLRPTRARRLLVRRPTVRASEAAAVAAEWPEESRRPSRRIVSRELSSSRVARCASARSVGTA